MTNHPAIQFIAIFIVAATSLMILLDAVGNMIGGEVTIFHLAVILVSSSVLLGSVLLLGFLLYQADRKAGKIADHRQIGLYERMIESSKR
ncbi:MAG: hypothetical protein ACXAB4_13220 [Candidatus Hodarchaeales archaeon]|jgi:hypothetical protein